MIGGIFGSSKAETATVMYMFTPLFSFGHFEENHFLLLTVMESVGAFADGEWASFSRMFSADHGFEYPFSHEHDDNFMISSTLCSSLEATMTEAGVTESSFCSLDALNSSLQYIFQENGMGSGCSSTSVSMPSSNHDCYYFSDCNNSPMINNNCMPMDYCMAGEKNCSFPPAFPDILVEESVRVNGSDGQLEAIAVPAKEWQLKRKIDTPGLNAEEGDKTNIVLSGNPKKKPRTSRDVQKSPKNVSKKIQKLTSCAKDEEESNAGQSSSSCSSEDDIASQELNGVEPGMPSAPTTLSGKTRASRGSATDPQSLYARKRRERINERLRILQNLVPNGTKVDISTMLEEAVEYVKFLKLQIKLLSSDEMWMYAPIAYNGMDIGLNRNMSL